jgi:tetratricopeptide (TPR) repeat protein
MISSCSTRKNKFINRNYHALTTKYNVLFNGNEALNEGVIAIKHNYKEDFWNVLPIEPKAISKGNVMPGTAKNPHFEKAEEKAVKAVQMHSMNLKGKEQNSQISEAYLLLGKARYYDQRYIPALDAFNYTIRYYNDAEKVNEAKLWREKTNIALENEDVAIENLNILLSEPKLDKEVHENLATTLAQAYINVAEYDKAIRALDTAISYNKDKAFRSRLLFIKGQLYAKLGLQDSANIAYQAVEALKRKGPRNLYINAIIQQQLIQGDSVQAMVLYNKLEKNRENRPFLGRIYYEKAMLALNNNNGEAAEKLFNQAIDKAKNDNTLKAKSYEQLADYYFNTSKYTTSGTFYAKVLPLLDKKTKQYRKLKKRLDNLDDVIKYEAIAKKTDSILKLTKMSKEELTTYFNEYIAKLKEADALVEANKAVTNEAASSLTINTNSGQNNGFYFYNQTAVSYGRVAFNKKWGDRILEDFWRYADKSVSTMVASEEEEETAAVSEEDKYDVAKYIATVPTDIDKIAKIKENRDFAYYQLGLIYKEQFKENELAVAKLEKVLSFKPVERLVLPAKYNLYKLYELLGNTAKANKHKEDITTNYADSQYAKIIVNPEALLNDTTHNPDTLYRETKEVFLAKDYLKALDLADKHAKSFFGTSEALRFELLKAKILGRVEGLKSFKKATEFIALNHPKSKEGKEAQALLDGLIANLETKNFTKDATEKHWKIIYETTVNASANGQAINTINQAKQSLARKSIKTSLDFYTKDKSFLVIHGFKSEKEAAEFAKYMDSNGYVIANKKHIISSNDYALVQIKKNIVEYK